jgi:hypothetical protein
MQIRKKWLNQLKNFFNKHFNEYYLASFCWWIPSSCENHCNLACTCLSGLGLLCLCLSFCALTFLSVLVLVCLCICFSFCAYSFLFVHTLVCLCLYLSSVPVLVFLRLNLAICACPASLGKEKTKCDRIAPSHPLSWPCVSDLLAYDF